MRDGQDKVGIWTIIEESTEFVSLLSFDSVFSHSLTR